MYASTASTSSLIGKDVAYRSALRSPSSTSAPRLLPNPPNVRGAGGGAEDASKSAGSGKKSSSSSAYVVAGGAGMEMGVWVVFFGGL
jgi:hypothetical protein